MSKLLQCYWPPFFVIALILAAMMLNGCTVTPLPLSGAVDNSGPVFATLADANDPVEMAAAPVVNRLALYTHDVASVLKAGKITRQYAIDCRDRERELRRQIESAVSAKNINAIRSASATLDRYIHELEVYQ